MASRVGIVGALLTRHEYSRSMAKGCASGGRPHHHSLFPPRMAMGVRVVEMWVHDAMFWISWVCGEFVYTECETGNRAWKWLETGGVEAW